MVTASNVSQFRADLIDALKALETKYSIKIETGTIRYNDAGLTARLDAVTIINGEKMVNPHTEVNAQQYLCRCGHAPVDKIIGAEVELQDGTHGKITDFSNRKKNTPFTVKIGDKLYWVTLGSIRTFKTPVGT
ncbi:MAG: hypothetical protein LBU17_09565 [Treponema sp.]|jgi:CDGSH-type Zn-finger protein|nr:hypothetical protein [Treponema sp.]